MPNTAANATSRPLNQIEVASATEHEAVSAITASIKAYTEVKAQNNDQATQTQPEEKNKKNFLDILWGIFVPFTDEERETKHKDGTAYRQIKSDPIYRFFCYRHHSITHNDSVHTTKASQRLGNFQRWQHIIASLAKDSQYFYRHVRHPTVEVCQRETGQQG